MLIQNINYIFITRINFKFLFSLKNNNSTTASSPFVKNQIKISVKNNLNILSLKASKLKVSSAIAVQKKAVCVRIKVTSNNIFCTFWSINGSKTFKVRSAGMKKVTISKKRLFFGAKIVIQSFINELKLWKKAHRNKNTLFFYSLNAPTKIRNFIIRNIIKHATNINVEYSKPFNGCTARKKRRKKRLRFRSFK